jgi:protein translocase SEC61 complex gamma subunit
MATPFDDRKVKRWGVHWCGMLIRSEDEPVEIKAFLSSCKRLIKLVGRPSRDEVWTYIKTGVIGIGIIGVIGFIVKLISSMLQVSAPTA